VQYIQDLYEATGRTVGQTLMHLTDLSNCTYCTNPETDAVF